MLTCMKGFSSFGAFIILAVGVAMTAVTIYGYTHSEIFLDNTEQRNTILGIMAAADALIILAALLGICGIKKGNAFLICIFQLFVLIFLIVFFALGVAAEVLPGKFFQGNCTQSTNAAIEVANEVYGLSTEYFCKEKCPCSLLDSSIETYYDQDQKKQLTNSTKYFRNQTDGKNRSQDCSALDLTDEQKRMAVALEGIQNLLDCSGWCGKSDNLIYRFSNVNKGKPLDYCYDSLKGEVDKYGGIIGLASFITAAFLLMVCAVNTCICCHPSRKNLKMKDRFVYIRNGHYEKI